MRVLTPLNDAALTRAIQRLRNPVPGGKVEAAINFGVDVTLLIEQLKLSPAERARRMHDLANTAELLRGKARDEATNFETVIQWFAMRASISS